MQHPIPPILGARRHDIAAHQLLSMQTRFRKVHCGALAVEQDVLFVGAVEVDGGHLLIPIPIPNHRRSESRVLD